MRNCSAGVKYLCFFSVCILFLISGCATPKHSNTLIFGTNTKFGLDVSADPSGSPSITVGYKRQEAVWMPLLANQGVVLTNQQDVVEIPGECKEENCLFIGTVCKDKECKDKECKDRDTYSVLASFGAKFSGEAAGGPKATGGLAQYFATGLAARILAKEGGAKIVSVQPEAIYYKEVEKQLEESSRILRCYVSIREDDLPKIWEDAKKQGLFREEDSFDVIMKWYQEAIGNPTVRAENLRKAHRRYASEIYITEGADPQRVNALRKHRETVCGLARE